MTSPAADRAAEAAEAQAALNAEVEAHAGWKLRDIIHWLINRGEPHYVQAGAPSAAAVRVLVDKASGYVPPEVTLSQDEQNQLTALLEKQRQVDEAKATAAAGVEQHDDVGL